MSDRQYKCIIYMLWLLMLHTSEKGSFSAWLAVIVLIFLAIADIIEWFLNRKIKKMEEEGK
jgi:hypothetical protein